MRSNQSMSIRFSRITRRGLSFYLPIVLLTVWIMPGVGQAQTFSVVYSFRGAPDGATPYSGVIADNAGNLYGTTNVGGKYGWGTVYKVDSSGRETVLHSFAGAEHNGHDGLYPWSGVVMDGSDNFYGTTYEGGTGSCYLGCGTVYELSAAGKIKILHSFQNAPDGAWPYFGSLVRGSSGSLYGTTNYGGASGILGTIFKVDSTGKESVIYSFNANQGGAYPFGGLIADQSGNLYGTAQIGGQYNSGTVYRLNPAGKLTTLHSFDGGGFNGNKDGGDPEDTLVRDAKGNIYGTTLFGGTYYYYGAIFKINSKGAETLVHSFTGGSDGANPYAGLALDAQGNLYGTASAGGTYGQGVVFKLNPAGKLTTLHEFTGGHDGGVPLGGTLWLSPKDGSLYGTASAGGKGKGVVFRIKP